MPRSVRLLSSALWLDGVAYYTPEAVSKVWRIDLGRPEAGERMLAWYSDLDIELSPDGSFLFVSAPPAPSSLVCKLDAANGGACAASSVVEVAESAAAMRTHRLSPGGQHLYVNGYQLDAVSLEQLGTAGSVLAEDNAGTLAFRRDRAFDAGTRRSLEVLYPPASAATLMVGDQELWWLSDDGRMNYRNVAEFLTSTSAAASAPPPR